MVTLTKSILAVVVAVGIVACSDSSSDSGAGSGAEAENSPTTLPESLNNCITELGLTLTCSGVVNDLSELTQLPDLTSLHLTDVPLTESIWQTLPSSLPLITELQLINNGLPSSADLSSFPNLTSLTINSNLTAFKDPISPLLNEISSLHQLQVLDLSDSGENEIQGLDLSNFNELRILNLSNNLHLFFSSKSGEGLLGQIENLTQLTALNLKDSYLIDIDLSLLADTLTKLNLDGNGDVFFRTPSGVADVGKLENMTKLTELRIAKTGVLSLDLSKMAGTLTILDLSDTPLFTDHETGIYDIEKGNEFLSQIESMTQLTELRIGQTLTPSTAINGIDLDAIATNLTALDLSGHRDLFDGLTNDEGVLGQLKTMDKLTSLHLESTGLTDMDIGAIMNNFTALNLSNNPDLFIDTTGILAQIETASSLIELELSNNQLPQFSGSNLGELTFLDLRDNNQITLNSFAIQNKDKLRVFLKGTGFTEVDEITLMNKYPAVDFSF